MPQKGSKVGKKTIVTWAGIGIWLIAWGNLTCGFDRNVAQLSVKIITTPVPSTYCRRWLKADIGKLQQYYFEFPDRGIQFHASPTSISGLDAEVSKVNSKDVCPKGMILRKKSASSWIQTNNFLFASQVLYHLNTVCCGFERNVA